MFEYEPMGRPDGTILYARCFDEALAEAYMQTIKPYVSKIIMEFDAPNVAHYCPEYRIYILESEVDSVIEAFDSGKFKKEVHL